jgi:hypothetical protein
VIEFALAIAELATRPKLFPSVIIVRFVGYDPKRRHLYFPNDLACVIHNADARLLDRNVQSSKLVHVALLLLMLEAVFTDLVSPSA